MDSFANKVAVVTGGATGIGWALSQGLAKQGATVVLASTNAQKLEEAAAHIRGCGQKADAISCDVTDLGAVRNLASTVMARYGRVDFLFANAGVTTAGPFVEHSDGDWNWVYDVVLRGVTNCVQAFYPHFAEQGHGHIAVVGSQAGLVPDWVIGHGPYSSAKAAVMALAVALRPEAAEHGVRVSLIVPAGVRTDILKSDRSRAKSYGPSLSGSMWVREGVPASLPGTSDYLTPEAVADIILRGVSHNEHIIVTHGGLKPLAEEYFQRILSAYDDALAR